MTGASRSENGAIQGGGSPKVKLRYWSMAKPQNIVGPQIRKLRYQQELTQDMLAARCARCGWDISRGTLSKVEAQFRCVTDSELLILSRALRVRLEDVFPPRMILRA